MLDHARSRGSEVVMDSSSMVTEGEHLRPNQVDW
jgi:hypothetical protein